MKKGLILASILLLAACNGNDNSLSKNSLSSSSNSSSISVNSSSSEVKLDSVEKVLDALKSNYTVNYTSSNGTYNIYKTNNYIYDEELGGGQFVLYDDTIYVYTLHNNVVLPKTPSNGVREDFENFYPVLDFNMDAFTIENGVYTTTDEATLFQLGLLVNSLPEAKATLFMDNGFLNFRFFDSYGKVVITGKVFGIENTKVDALETYLKDKIDPETQVLNNDPLIEVLGELSNNFTFIGQNSTNKNSTTLLLNENYVANFTGTRENKENYAGYISLDDGLHYFSIEEGVVNVDFEIVNNKDFIKENYVFKKHDFTKFSLIEDNTYITSDYYNVKNLCELLLIDSTNINMIKIIVNKDDNSVNIYFMNNHNILFDGIIYDINSTEISELSAYLDKTLVPDLQHYQNSELIEATKDLKNNFTFVRTDEVLDSIEKDFYGSISTSEGRKEYKSDYSNFPSNDYIAYENNAYSYVIDENKVSPLAYRSISREEYDANYSFESIDFTHFMPLGNNIWMTNSKKYMRTLSKMFGSNPYDEYHYQATVKLEEGKIYFEIVDTSFGVNVSGYLDKINETTLPLIDEYKLNNSEPSLQSYENSELIDVISKIRDTSNFTVEYHDDPEYGLFFTAGDYDYWTKDAVYFGFYQDGFVTATKSKYVYNFGWKVNEEDETKSFVIADHPSLQIEKIEDYNPFKKLSNEQINSIMPYEEDKYISFNNDIINVFVEALQLGGSSILGYAGVILEIENGNLVAHVIDQSVVSYDENGKRVETYEIFASATFTNVGTTVIPSFANMPTIK